MSADEISQPAMVGDKPDTETYAGEIAVTKSNGIKVDVKFEFTYPRGEGISLAQAIDQFGDLAGGANVFQHLINVGDDSLLAAAARMQDTDDEDPFDDYDDEEEED